MTHEKKSAKLLSFPADKSEPLKNCKTIKNKTPRKKTRTERERERARTQKKKLNSVISTDLIVGEEILTSEEIKIKG